MRASAKARGARAREIFAELFSGNFAEISAGWRAAFCAPNRRKVGQGVGARVRAKTGPKPASRVGHSGREKRTEIGGTGRSPRAEKTHERSAKKQGPEEL